MATAANVFRDFVTDGVPASGANKPKKREIRTLLAGYEQIITAFTSNGGLIYSSLALLNADLSRPANSMAWVMGDPIAANNGVYGKVGASGAGSWTRRADLPFPVIVAEDNGAGTPNAIQATSAIPVSSSSLVTLTIYESNTSSPVSISFNGGDPLVMKTNSGNDIQPSGLPSVVLGRVSGSTFRLVSDVVSSAIVAQAEAAANDARDYRDQAQAAAAGVTLPSAVAGTFLRQKSDASGYETRTPAQVASDINVQQRNVDGGFTMSATSTTQAWDNGRYGGGWFASHRFASEDDALTGGSRGTVAIDRKVVGTGTNGPATADVAVFLSSSKKNYLASTVNGEIDVMMLYGAQGREADLGGILTDLEKVGGSTGGYVAQEAAAKWLDPAGNVAKRMQTIVNLGGQGSGFYGVTGVNGVGFWAEAQIGNFLAGFVCDQSGSATFDNVIIATTGRSIGSTYYKVDNGGRTYGGTGSGASPAFSFMADPDTGIGRIGSDQLGFTAGGVYRFYVDVGALVPATDNAYSIGRATTGRVSNIYTVNAPTVGSDERLKTEIVDSPLGLDFVLGLRPVAYKLKRGGTEIEMVEDFEDVEEQETIEDDVVREEKYFDGAKTVTIQRHERGLKPVWDEPVQATDPKTGELLFRDVKVPRLDEDGLPIVKVIPRDPVMARSEAGEVIEIAQPPEIVPVMDTVREPVMQAVPKMKTVRKPVMRPVETERAGNRQHFGLIAQEVLEALNGTDFGGHVIDDLSDPESLQSLRYEQFVPILIKAVQELSARVKELEG